MNMTLTSISRVEVVPPTLLQTSSQKPLLSERNTSTAVVTSATELSTTKETYNNTDNET